MNKIKITVIAMMSFWHINAAAADLVQVYQQAQMSDPIFQETIAQALSTKEGVPISIAGLLPNIAITANPAITREGYSGSSYLQPTPGVPSGSDLSVVYPRNVTYRTYNLALTINQTIFNFAQFTGIASQVALSKSADATLNAALQDLMVRVSKAYFDVLNDEDNLMFSEASKIAFAEQLDQIQQQYKVGLKTLTDVYIAEASYDSSVAKYIAAQTALANDKENLRVITGIYYPHLSALSENFPLIKPQPTDVECWVKTAEKQNWSIKAEQYKVQSALQLVRQQFSGHLPTLSVQASSSRQYQRFINPYSTFTNRNGPGTQSDRQVMLNLNIPIFSGGAVVAQTQQATYNYRASQQRLEKAIRDTFNLTRQSYLNIVAGISQINADKKTVKSTISSLEGLEASYEVGTQTLVDILNQQQRVYEAQKQYAFDRYAFVINILRLKQAAGTLSYEDLHMINAWLEDVPRKKIARNFSRHTKMSKSGKSAAKSNIKKLG